MKINNVSGAVQLGNFYMEKYCDFAIGQDFHKDTLPKCIVSLGQFCSTLFARTHQFPCITWMRFGI